MNKSDKAKVAKVNFPLVAIGASAGGFPALKEFFGNLPKNTGAAFIVVIHRGTEQVSLLREILSKHSNMVVLEATEGLKIKPNNIYLSPPNQNMGIKNNVLHFISFPHFLPPIDYLFKSLAKIPHCLKFGLVLSGTGADGTAGVRAIKSMGGIVMAQDSASAQFVGMPDNAVATGMVDFILPPKEMAAELVRCIKGSKSMSADLSHVNNPALLDSMDKIFLLIHQHVGNDFSFYKTNTMCRRIERHMHIHHIADPEKYIQFLKDNPHEIEMLFKELLIGVTSFFRDKAAFESLTKKALPNLLADKPDGYVFRAWIPACSTGEEAYSIAITLQEYMESVKKKFSVQIFATDLDMNAINVARRGGYFKNIEIEMDDYYLKKYFIKSDGIYYITKNIREMVIFAPQNVFQDPPFTRMDIISCRNLLIYLDGQLQKQIIPLFHYALKPGGILFLGSSESIGSFHNLFDAIDNRWKLFLKKEVSTLNHRTLLGFPVMPKKNTPENTSLSNYSNKANNTNIVSAITNTLLREHVPPSVIVNSKGVVFYIHGKVGAWLEPASGQVQMSQNIIDMAREGLGHELAILIRKAEGAGENGIVKTVHFKNNGEDAFVEISAKKIINPEHLHGLIMITFNQKRKEDSAVPSKVKAKNDWDLSQELESIKKDLRSSIEDLEVSNEELQSVNEELQSTNEELETSKEEMQSLNEELQTVNSELEEKVQELSHANDDMKNLLNNTGIATIFLDNNFNIRRFTIQAQSIIHLMDRDIGRPLRDIVSDLNYENLVDDAATVLKTLVFKEVEVTSKTGEWYFVRIMPYRTASNVIDGLVITFVNISKLKHTEQMLKTSEEKLSSLSDKNKND